MAAGCRIVNADRNRLVEQLREVARAHLRRRDGEELRVAALAVLQAFVGEKEERFIAPVVKLGNIDRAIHDAADTVISALGPILAG